MSSDRACRRETLAADPLTYSRLPMYYLLFFFAVILFLTVVAASDKSLQRRQKIALLRQERDGR